MDLRVPFGFGGADRRIAADLGDPALAERFQVPVAVGDARDLQDVDLHADAGEVTACLLDDAACQRVTVGVQVLDGHGGGDAAQATGQDLVDLALQLREVGGQEALHRGLHCLVVGTDAHQPDGLDVNGNTVVGQRILQVDVHVERFERHDVHPLDAGHLEPRATAHHLGLATAREHRDLIRRHLDVVAHVDQRQRYEEHQRRDGDDDDDQK